jgi:hypothetical protein
MPFDINQLVDSFASKLGLTGTSLIATFAILMFVCQAIGKAIPEDATGALGFLRKVCKVIGLYVTNRVTNGLTITQAVKNANDHALIANEKVTAIADSAVIVTRNEKGHFQSVKSPLLVTLLVFALILPLCACTTAQTDRLNVGVNVICRSADTAQEILLFAKKSKRTDQAARIVLLLQTVCPAIYNALPPAVTTVD